MKVSLNKEDVWADLKYALDELDRPPLDMRSYLVDGAGLHEQSEDEARDRLLESALFSGSYSKARMRAETKIAHEAIEKGLKAILLEGGLSRRQVRSRGHELHLLLEDVQKRNPMAFSALERCFDSTIQYLESVTLLKYNTNIVDYFREHGQAEVFVAKRYESIEGNSNKYGMIGFVYTEMIRALLSLISGRTPRDIGSRIEEEARKSGLSRAQT